MGLKGCLVGRDCRSMANVWHREAKGGQGKAYDTRSENSGQKSSFALMREKNGREKRV